MIIEVRHKCLSEEFLEKFKRLTKDKKYCSPRNIIRWMGLTPDRRNLTMAGIAFRHLGWIPLTETRTGQRTWEKPEEDEE